MQSSAPNALHICCGVPLSAASGVPSRSAGPLRTVNGCSGERRVGPPPATRPCGGHPRGPRSRTCPATAEGPKRRPGPWGTRVHGPGPPGPRRRAQTVGAPRACPAHAGPWPWGGGGRPGGARAPTVTRDSAAADTEYPPPPALRGLVQGAKVRNHRVAVFGQARVSARHVPRDTCCGPQVYWGCGGCGGMCVSGAR